ncbi:MAG: type II secretion system protein [Planctomycetota bacterium]
MPSPQPRHCQAFTLVEILIVVVILGILASLVVANVADSDDDARRNVFVRNLGHFQQGLTLYMETHNELPPDTNTGDCPAALAEMFDERSFETLTPIGGSWDVEVEESGVILAVGVHFNTSFSRSDTYMAQIDAACDDGDITSGNFRKIADNRFYWVLE